MPSSGNISQSKDAERQAIGFDAALAGAKSPARQSMSMKLSRAGSRAPPSFFAMWPHTLSKKDPCPLNRLGARSAAKALKCSGEGVWWKLESEAAQASSGVDVLCWAGLDMDDLIRLEVEAAAPNGGGKRPASASSLSHFCVKSS